MHSAEERLVLTMSTHLTLVSITISNVNRLNMDGRAIRDGFATA